MMEENNILFGKDISQEQLSNISDFYKESKDLRDEMILKKAQSAGDSAKTARDMKSQGVFPIRGKMINEGESPELNALFESDMDLEKMYDMIDSYYNGRAQDILLYIALKSRDAVSFGLRSAQIPIKEHYKTVPYSELQKYLRMFNFVNWFEETKLKTFCEEEQKFYKDTEKRYREEVFGS